MTSRLAEAARGWLPAKAVRLSARQRDRILAPARIERHGELAALYLSGTHFEMGYQHGVLVRDLIHGYNYDLMQPEHALTQPFLVLVFYRPTSGIPFVTLNTAGSVGVNAGMNAAGISVAWDNTYLSTDHLKRGIDQPVAPLSSPCGVYSNPAVPWMKLWPS